MSLLLHVQTEPLVVKGGSIVPREDGGIAIHRGGIQKPYVAVQGGKINPNRLTWAQFTKKWATTHKVAYWNAVKNAKTNGLSEAYRKQKWI